MIPVVINNRDLNIRPLIWNLLRLNAAEIHVVDNASTYPPTVAWIERMGPSRKATNRAGRKVPIVIHRGPNRGPRGACAIVREMRQTWIKRGYRFYATTDSDLSLMGVAYNLFETCIDLFSQHRHLVKVGCALRLDDLPDTAVAQQARAAEARFWQHSLGATATTPGRNRVAPIYEADIDTTLAVYRLSPPWDGSYGPALRLGGDFAARHVPWYHTAENRPADYRWYLDHADPQGTVYTAALKSGTVSDASPESPVPLSAAS